MTGVSTRQTARLRRLLTSLNTSTGPAGSTGYKPVDLAKSAATTPSRQSIHRALILETLKKVQGGIADLRNAVADVRQDTRAIKDEIVSLRTIMGEFIKTNARRETDYLHLAARVDRIERRLADDEHPPAHV